MNIYVGNVDFSVGERELVSLFITYGDVDTIKIITDKETGQNKGYCFITMPDQAEAQKAIDALNGMDFQGRNLVVKESQPGGQKPENRFQQRPYNQDRNDRNSGFQNRRPGGYQNREGGGGYNQSRPYNDNQNREGGGGYNQSRPYNDNGGYKRPYDQNNQSRPYNDNQNREGGGYNQSRPNNDNGGYNRPYDQNNQSRPYNDNQNREGGGYNQNRPYNNNSGYKKPFEQNNQSPRNDGGFRPRKPFVPREVREDSNQSDQTNNNQDND